MVHRYAKVTISEKNYMSLISIYLWKKTSYMICINCITWTTYRFLVAQQETHQLHHHLELYLHNSDSQQQVWYWKNNVISVIHSYNEINTKLSWQIHVFASCDVIQFTVKKGHPLDICLLHNVQEVNIMSDIWQTHFDNIWLYVTVTISQTK